MNVHPSLDSMDAAYLGFFDNTRPTWCSPALKIEVMDEAEAGEEKTWKGRRPGLWTVFQWTHNLKSPVEF